MDEDELFWEETGRINRDIGRIPTAEEVKTSLKRAIKKVKSIKETQSD